MITYLLPSRNRPARLAATLEALGGLDLDRHEPVDGAEVIVVDDASAEPIDVAPALANGMPVRVLRRPRREGAAARNVAALAARGEWLVMLDDDSWPRDEAVVDVLVEAPSDVAAIGARITVPGAGHEQGGLPEVIVGCGAAIRRSAYLDVGGYDPSFHYYAEEYDLCAKLLRAGWRVMHDWRFRVVHEKTPDGRDMSLIVRRLVRNNGWVVQRYAPPHEREAFLATLIERYGRIAVKEAVGIGYERGMDDLLLTIDAQPRRPMDEPTWDRFTGAAAVRETLRAEPPAAGARVAVVDAGKHVEVLRRALDEQGIATTDDEDAADVRIIGTLSPGPMMEAWARRRDTDRPARRPWTPEGADVAETVR